MSFHLGGEESTNQFHNLDCSWISQTLLLSDLLSTVCKSSHSCSSTLYDTDTNRTKFRPTAGFNPSSTLPQFHALNFYTNTTSLFLSLSVTLLRSFKRNLLLFLLNQAFNKRWEFISLITYIQVWIFHLKVYANERRHQSKKINLVQFRNFKVIEI